MTQDVLDAESEARHPTPLRAAPRDRPAVTAHRIDIEVVGLGERGHRYRVTYEGRTLIASCRVPGLDACRALLALGITGRLEMWRPGKPWPDMQLDIEGAAKWTVLENEDEVPRLVPWRPFPRAARDAVSSGAVSPPERGVIFPVPEPA